MNIAIIGCGAIAKTRHAPAVAAHPEAALYAVCDPVKANADALAKATGAKAVYKLEDVLADTAVDAVIVCTPERFHCTGVIAALAAGKDVLCEKPLAMDPQEGRAILTAWQKSGRKLMVAFSQRLTAEHQLAKKLLAQGAIGKPIAFRTALAHHGVEYATIAAPGPDFYDKKLAGIGDVMLSVGCHRLDLMPYLFGSGIKAVSALTPTIDKTYADGSPIGAADHAMVTAELENGIVGTLWISWCAYGAMERQTLIYGTEGSMSIYEAPGIVVRRRDGTQQNYETAPDPEEGRRITANFIDFVNGAGDAVCDGRDGQACLLALEAVKRAHREGRRVAVAEIE